MTHAEHLAQARSELAQLELTEKNRAFLEKAFELLADESIEYIEVERTYKGAKLTVHLVGGTYREFVAG